jgi:hypothetical protein
MTDGSNDAQKAPKSNKSPKSLKSPQIDFSRLFGFDRVVTGGEQPAPIEEAVGVAYNKRGEGPPVSDIRLKCDAEPIGMTPEGFRLYRFRYIGDSRVFTGVMAQDLLADERHAEAVRVLQGGYFGVDYTRLGIERLVTEDMRQAGARALANALSQSNAGSA